MNIENVAVIGCGKLGGTMVGCLASRGFKVTAVDIAESAVQALNEGKAPAQENGLDELIAANKQNINATMSHETAILKSEISFVIIPTPSDKSGAFTNQYAIHAFKEIGKALAKKDTYHTVVLTSTVMPGSTRSVLLPVLEEASGKKCGKDFGLCYSPEFIALGTVIRDYLNPDFYLVGEFDQKSGDYLEYVNNAVALNHAPTKRMTLENAELAKIAVNSFVTMKISYANMLADMCERIPGGNVDVVSDALGMDKRIGRHYLTGGFGYGGPCFPRDNVALDYAGRKLGANTVLLRTNDDFNRNISPRIVERIRSYINDDDTISVLGLSYKPLSHLIEESPGIYLCDALASLGYRVLGYDPLANEYAKQTLKNTIILDKLSECLDQSKVILVTNNDDVFTSLEPDDLIGSKDNVTVVDFWRCLPDKIKNDPRITYVPLGMCLDDEEASKKLSSLWA